VINHRVFAKNGKITPKYHGFDAKIGKIITSLTRKENSFAVLFSWFDSKVEKD